MKKVVIIGGGLSGLIAAFCLSKAGVEVTLIEKKSYPFHRVCGEYISNETIPFLTSLGLFPFSFHPPAINKLLLTSVNGKSAILNLDMGGFGISRYTFDHFLFLKASQAGVTVYENTEADSIQYENDEFTVKTKDHTFRSDIVIGSFGKRSKLDITLNRGFIKKRSPYVGVKYHILTSQDSSLIALHNFKNGYCGISKIEDEKFNLCYLTHRDNLRLHGSIQEMEENVLFKNPSIKSIFFNSEFLFDKPETINEITFETKEPVLNHILMSGDAAGMITPLCGNGMALAIHSAKVLSEYVNLFCMGKMGRSQMEKQYEIQWKKLFARRLIMGRTIQHLFGNEWTSNLAVNLANYAPPIARHLVAATHGNPF